MQISRRNFMIGTGVALLGAACTAGGETGGGEASESASSDGGNVVKIGMNIPMTGDYAPWGLPGLYGSQVIPENVNAAGGITIGGEQHTIEIIGYDHGYDTEKALQGYKKLVLEDKVKMVMMLGGSTVASIVPFSNSQNMLTTTLLPSDITPDTPNIRVVAK